MRDPSRLLWLGFVVITVGFAVTAFGAVSQQASSVSSGGFVLIGPFLFGFGNGPNAGLLEAVGVVIAVLFLAAYVVSLLAWRSAGRRRADIPSQSE